MDTRIDKSVFARISGSLFMALCSGLPDQGVRLAIDVLRDLAENPQVRPEERELYAAIAASTPIEIINGA